MACPPAQRVPAEFFQRDGGLAQSVECVVRNDEAPGSKPGFSTFYCTRSRLWLSGKKPLGQRGAPGSIPGLACCSIGAVGSALVLCAGGRGFEPLMEHFFLGLRYGVDRPVQHGWVAEWSKALVLGTSLFGGVGSNPTPVIIFVRLI